MLKKEIEEKILKKAIFLEKFGLNELAWTQEDAKNLIHAIMEDKIGILGGDVYKLTFDRLEPLDDNWSCKLNKKESEDEFYLRSKNESLVYIENYPLQSTFNSSLSNLKRPFFTPIEQGKKEPDEIDEIKQIIGSTEEEIVFSITFTEQIC